VLQQQHSENYNKPTTTTTTQRLVQLLAQYDVNSRRTGVNTTYDIVHVAATVNFAPLYITTTTTITTTSVQHYYKHY